MINAAIVGLGWWGKTLVEAVQGTSDVVQFVAGTTRTMSPDVQAFADAQRLTLAANYEALLADPNIDAVVLATPHSVHAAQVIAAANARKHVFCEKPFALTKADAEAADKAKKDAKAAEAQAKKDAKAAAAKAKKDANAAKDAPTKDAKAAKSDKAAAKDASKSDAAMKSADKDEKAKK